MIDDVVAGHAATALEFSGEVVHHALHTVVVEYAVKVSVVFVEEAEGLVIFELAAVGAYLLEKGKEGIAGFVLHGETVKNHATAHDVGYGHGHSEVEV